MGRFPGHAIACAIMLVAVALPGCAGPEAPKDGTPAAADPVATRIVDVNCDGVADVVHTGSRVYTDEDTDGEVKHVDVVFGGGALPAQQITNADLGDGLYEATGFGAAVVAADLNRDGCSDVVVSDPTRGEIAGTVWVLWGSTDGVSAANSAVLAEGPAEGLLGKSLAYVPLPEPVLAIGSDEHAGGVIRLYPVSAEGALGTPKLLDLDSPGIPGKVRWGVNVGFGDRLAASDDVLVAGSPWAEVAGRAEAGAVYVLRLGAARLSRRG